MDESRLICGMQLFKSYIFKQKNLFVLIQKEGVKNKKMDVQFCGAAQFVTGSSHLITLDDGYKILLDCGLFQGRGRSIWDRNNTWYFKPAEIDCLILSHAHIDHTGRVPQLVKDGYQGDVHCTHATRSLCNIMLMDSAKIQERDVYYHNKDIQKKRKKSKSDTLRVALYTQEDVDETLDRFIGYSYNRWYKLNERVSVLFKDAGHILGSATLTLKLTENGKTRMVGFTGDLGRPDRPILRDPQQMPEVEYLLCESTYGDKDHELPPEQNEEFLAILKHTCVEKKGKLIIPAFSVGRTQEIVYMLDQLETAGMLPKLPIYVDSPLATNATTIFGSHPECFDSEMHQYLTIDSNPFGFNDLNYIRHVDQSKALNDTDEPCVIISSSGMMNAGRVKHHLFNNIDNAKATFLIVGYCSPDTPGGILKTGVDKIKLFGEWKEVKADIKVMDSFSAHGDRKEMYDAIKNQKSLKKLFLVHGDLDTQEKFKEYLGERGFNDIEIPEEGQTFQLQ